MLTSTVTLNAVRIKSLVDSVPTAKALVSRLFERSNGQRKRAEEGVRPCLLVTMAMGEEERPIDFGMRSRMLPRKIIETEAEYETALELESPLHPLSLTDRT